MASRSFKVGELLPSEVRAAAIVEGYGPKGLSRWVSEAIVEFVKDLRARMWEVGTGDNVEGFNRVFKLQLSEAAEDAIERAVAVIRGVTPNEEGVRSAVVRSAIRDRLTSSRKHPKFAQRLRIEQAQRRSRAA
jgi:hypothetical protein